VEARVEVSFPRPELDQPRGYEIRIGAGLLEALGSDLARRCPAHRYALISDSNVAPLYADRVLASCQTAPGGAQLFVFPAGEENKTREQWIRLSDDLLDGGFGRDSAVIALGGGVTGDLAGFVAATFLRGLPLVQLPTSLLAMIDSSVGGKTGVDTPAGKNLIGSFHQPDLVLADTDTLRTLPLAELRSGLAEAVKHGAIADGEYLDWIEAHAGSIFDLRSDALGKLIQRSVEIKARVVEADEREGGLRKILNFGHTVGHALEALSGFRLLHGEAVAIGMVVEAEIGERLEVTRGGTADRLRTVLARCGLPVRVPMDLTTSGIIEMTRLDKKSRAGRVEYALIREPGSPARRNGGYAVPVEDAAVRDAIDGNRPD